MDALWFHTDLHATAVLILDRNIDFDDDISFQKTERPSMKNSLTFLFFLIDSYLNFGPDISRSGALRACASRLRANN